MFLHPVQPKSTCTSLPLASYLLSCPHLLYPDNNGCLAVSQDTTTIPYLKDSALLLPVLTTPSLYPHRVTTFHLPDFCPNNMLVIRGHVCITHIKWCLPQIPSPLSCLNALLGIYHHQHGIFICFF
jgi:hypothetical protein